ncbi:MAG: hypothetical protein AB7I04_18370 [Pseudomonadales bacterium]
MTTDFRRRIQNARIWAAAQNCRSEVDRLVGELAGDELDLVGMYIERLRLGRGMYGEFSAVGDRRQLIREALEEAQDGFVYVSGLLMKIDRLLASEPVRGESSAVSAPHAHSPLTCLEADPWVDLGGSG